MRQLVFFLEEPSAREMLKGLLPKFLPEEICARFVVFEGKQDLEKRLPKRLRAWRQPDSLFLVLRDQDRGNCIDIKSNLAAKCADAGYPRTMVRIACHELETFYLGDLQAVAASIGPKSLAKMQNKAKYRNPDRLSNPALELKKIAPSYQKLSGSRDIGPHLDLVTNRSHSFSNLVSGINRLIEAQQP